MLHRVAFVMIAANQKLKPFVLV